MCGIIGLTANKAITAELIKGMEKLEYRGYDSAGLGVLDPIDHEIRCLKTTGDLTSISSQAEDEPRINSSDTGIGHTRWATHGKPNLINAHPQKTNMVAVVHNGIIENNVEIRNFLCKQGKSFFTQTDTEVIPVLITFYIEQGYKLEQAVVKAIGQLEGKFALAMIFAHHPRLLVVVKKGSPMALGYGCQFMAAASDAYTLALFTDKVCYLEDEDLAFINPEGAEIYRGGVKQQRAILTTNLTTKEASKNGFPNFMSKEINEVPSALKGTLEQLKVLSDGTLKLEPLSNDQSLAKIDRITLVACGSSYFAGYLARHWIEKCAGVLTVLENSSEFRYKQHIKSANEMAIFISQSGETADTVAALESAKEQNITTLAVVNTPHSTLDRLSDHTIYTKAGMEIGVASTKTFASQAAILFAFALVLARAKKQPLGSQPLGSQPLGSQNPLDSLESVVSDAQMLLSQSSILDAAAEALSASTNILYIGREAFYGVAMEGALKAKEIAYIHAEGILSGELKHGSLALVDENLPILALIPQDKLLRKNLSSIEEISSRGGKVIAVTDKNNPETKLTDLCSMVIELPIAYGYLSPIIYSLCLQILAYKIAILKGLDVDRPRNLAKSVTVE